MTIKRNYLRLIREERNVDFLQSFYKLRYWMFANFIEQLLRTRLKKKRLDCNKANSQNVYLQ